MGSGLTGEPLLDSDVVDMVLSKYPHVIVVRFGLGHGKHHSYTWRMPS